MDNQPSPVPPSFALSPPRRSPSRSPHQHILRPRRSFHPTSSTISREMLAANAGEPALRSPLRLADSRVNVTITTTTTATDASKLTPSSASSGWVKSSRSRGNGNGGLLFHGGQQDSGKASSAASAPSAPRISKAIVQPPSLKKLATTLSGAFSNKTKLRGGAANGGVAAGAEGLTKQGFDLSDWNHDLAAIASHPSSSSTSGSSSPSNSSGHQLHLSSSTRPAPPPANSLPALSTSGFSLRLSRDDLITPTATSFPPVVSFGYGHGLELPSEPTRRRKSEEMDDDDRAEFRTHPPHHQPPVYRPSLPPPSTVPTRRESHARAHSLAHAHTLRSSRTLSHHASSIVSSPSSTVFASQEPPPTPINRPRSFASTSDSNLAIAELDGENEDEEMDAFGTTTLSKSTSKRPLFRSNKDHSLFSKSSDPLFNPPSIPTTNSHPSWTGDGFGTVSVSPRVGKVKNSGGTSTLDTLKESGPPLDYFSVSKGKEVEKEKTWMMSSTSGGSQSRKKIVAMRRRSGDADLFGRVGGGEGDNVLERRKMSLGEKMSTEEEYDYLDSGMVTPGEIMGVSASKSMPRPFQTPQAHSSERRGSLDSLYLASILHSPPPAPSSSLFPFVQRSQAGSSAPPAPHHPRFEPPASPHPQPAQPYVAAGGGGRKRNANGALLVGPTGVTHGSTSNLAAVSPLLPLSFSGGPGSPAPWNVRDTKHDMEEDEEDEEDEEMFKPEEDELGGRTGSWARLPPPPPLTDGATTSTSSSLSHSLSSQAGDHLTAVDSATSAPGNLSSSASAASTGSMGTAAGETSESGEYVTPQSYKHVLPLQAAFMSTGLVSKRARARDSGVGGMTPLPHIVATAPPLPPTQNIDLLANTSATNPPVPSIIAPHPLLATLSRVPSIMPDTPVKRASFAHPTASGIVVPSPCSSTSSSSSLRVPLDPLGHVPPPSPSNSDPTTDVDNFNAGPVALALGNVSPCSGRTSGSAGSGCIGRPTNGEVSPSAHASRSNVGRIQHSQPQSAAAGTIPWKRPAVFRRRSSGQLSSSWISNNAAVHGSGESGSSGGGFGNEPMTPTRSVGSRWSEAFQLVSTPTDSPDAISAPPNFVPPCMLPSSTSSNLLTFPPTEISAPLGRVGGRQFQSFPLSDSERRQRGPAAGRAQFKLRHSGSTILSLRQQELQQSAFFETNYTVLGPLGNGAFSDAFEVVDKQRGGVYAVKRTKNPFGGPRDRLRRLEEVDILRLFSTDDNRSPYLISLVEAWEQSGHLYIQTELCENGNLSHFLEEYGRLHEVLDEARVWKILTEITAGVAHLHSRDVIHLDLKPANVFITDRGHLKLGDFGLATRWPRADALSITRGAAVTSPGWETNSSDEIWAKEEGERRVRAKSNGDVPADLEREGDREYIAPEILGGRYGKAADVFSLGLIILEAAANVVLPDNGPAWHKLRSNDFSDVDLSRQSHELVVLLQGMLEKSPDQRLSIQDVAQQPVVARLMSMLDTSLRIEETIALSNSTSTATSTQDVDVKVPVLGAILPQDDSFIFEIFSSVFHFEGDGDDERDDMDIDS